MNKRIAIISPGNLPIPAIHGGAVESLVDTFLRYVGMMTNFNVDVYSVSEDITSELIRQNGNIKYIQVPKINQNRKIDNIIRRFRPQQNFSYYIKYVCSKLESNDYDIVIVENRPTFIYDISKATKAKVFLHLHNENFVSVKKYCRYVPKYCEKIIVVSEYIKGVVERNMYNANNVTVLYNGIDGNKFRKESDKSIIKRVRAKYGIRYEDTVICYTGRFSPEKGVKEVVEAYSRLNDLSNLVLLIIGSSWFGANSENNYINTVQKISTNCSNRIVFTGYIKNEDVAKIESVSDIAILPSLWNDPLPLTVIEAMASELPVITTIAGGIPEMCTCDTGILLQNNDALAESIEMAIRKLIIDTDLRIKLGKNGRERVDSRFTAECYSRNFINILLNE